MTNTKEILLNTFLNLSHEGGNLRDMAYAKSVLWVLHCEDKAIDIKTLVNLISQLIGQDSVPETDVLSAVNILVMRKHVIKKHGLYEISPNQKSEMDRQIKYSHGTTIDILKKRFPKQIDESILNKWFNDANSKYFAASADKLISLYSHKQKPISKVESVLKPVIASHGLKQYEGQLLQGYQEFLTSNDRTEEEKIFNLLSSVLASRLVAANLSSEVFSIDRFKGGDFLIDTNVLIGIGLERDEGTTKALIALGNMAEGLKIKFFVTDFTIDEYENVIKREREKFIALINSYSKSVYDEMSNDNQFFIAMQNLRCENASDVERFFDITLALPKKIGNVDITFLEGNSLRGSIYNEEYDEKLLSEISSETSKKGAKAIHDLRLNKLAEKINRSRKAFILTLDSSMENFALSKVNEKEEPLWLSLFSLVQILAINGGGPNFDPSDLAPLIKVFIEFEESTKVEKYDSRDMLLLLEKTERVNELSEMQMTSLLNKLHRIRLQRSPEEGVREITLELDRTLRKNSSDTDSKIREKDEVVEKLMHSNQDTTARLDQTCKNLKKQKAGTVNTHFLLRSLLYLGLGILVFWYIREEIFSDYFKGNRYDLISKILLIVSFIGLVATDYFTYTTKKLTEVESKTIC